MLDLCYGELGFRITKANFQFFSLIFYMDFTSTGL